MVYDRWGGSWGGAWALFWTGEEVTPPVVEARPDGGGARQPDISDPAHPYWRNRIEADEAPDTAAPPSPAAGSATIAERASDDSPTRSAHSPGAEIVKALLGVPLPEVGEISPSPPLADPTSPPSSVRGSDVDEDVLLLLLID